MKLTPQQALEEAKKRYPKGTIYKCASENYLIFDVESVEDFSIYRHQICAEEFKGVLYDLQTDQWAEIISTPKSLEDRLVDGFGFKVEVLDFGRVHKLTLDDLSVHIHYNGKEVKQINLYIAWNLVCLNPNNLEDFIKAYLRLF
jgi:hypothetical protein